MKLGLGASLLVLAMACPLALADEQTPTQAAIVAQAKAAVAVRQANDAMQQALEAAQKAAPVVGGPMVVQAPVVESETQAWIAQIRDGVVSLISLILTGLITLYLPRAISAFERRTGYQLADQQRASIMSAAMTAKGIIETKIDQGLMQVSNVTVTHPEVIAEAQAAISRVPDAATALKKSVPSMAETIVGLVDTGSKTKAPVWPDATVKAT